MNLFKESHEKLQERKATVEARYEQFKDARLTLDLTRGKPSSDQLDLSNALDGILEGFYLLQDGTDVRNYGGLLGIPEARQLGADILGISPSQTMVGGNSSLTLMYNMIAHLLPRWQDESSARNSKIKFLCPVPGYDRHFTICEHFDIEMINIDLTTEGPDMDVIESLVSEDPMIKGIWCVPKYSNPTGHTYTTDTVVRFAQLQNIAGDNFRIMWDNAYVAHHLSDDHDTLDNLMIHAVKAGTQDSVILLASTSKITFAGAGIAFLGTSETNLNAFAEYLSPQMIGFDKVNQLRHVRFLKDMPHLAEHMKKHQILLRPKFDLVQSKLANGIGDLGIAEWTLPKGGYFVSLNTLPGLATAVVQLAAEAGVKLTPAGATYPYGLDSENRNIRIAPTFPSLEDLGKAMDVFICCLELASINKLLTE